MECGGGDFGVGVWPICVDPRVGKGAFPLSMRCRFNEKL
jgi:hypothetical protein